MQVYFSSGSGEYIAFGGVFGECPALVRINIEKKSCSGLVVPTSVKTLTVPDIAGVDFEDGGAENGYKVPLVNLTVTNYCSDDFNDRSFSRAAFL